MKKFKSFNRAIKRGLIRTEMKKVEGTDETKPTGKYYMLGKNKQKIYVTPH